MLPGLEGKEMICPKDKIAMGKAGGIWSGRKKYQGYKCSKCGAVKRNPKELLN